jgi:outer membrane immunogenic protein
MNRFLLGIVAVPFSVLSPAFAADMPLKAPPMAPPIAAPNWSGFYFGANGGYGWGHADLAFPTSQFFADTAGEGFSARPSGGIVGGHFGVNWQFGPWVVGEETIIDWARLNQGVVGGVSPTYPADSFTTRMHFYDSATGRLGYALGNWLFYGKVGAAWTHLGLDLFSGPPIPDVAARYGQTVVGVTGGAGVEFMWMSNIVLGVEYDYASFKDQGIMATGVCTAAVCAGSAPAININGSNINVQTVLGRVSYLINWGTLGF